MAIIGISAALVALTYPLNRMVGRTFVPSEDMAEFTVHADTPQGTSIEGTTEIAQSVVREIGEQEGVSHVTYLAGADRYTHFHVYFYLLPVTERTVTQEQVTARVRKVLARHPAYSASVQARNPLGTGGNTAIQAVLLGPDIDKLYDYSQQILAKAQATPSLVDARTDYSDASPEVQVAVDRARAADLGVRMATVGNTLRLMVAGDDEISTYREAGEQYPVKIRVLESQRRDIGTVGKLTVTSAVRAAGADRQHRPHDPGLRTDEDLAVEPAVFHQPQRRRGAGPRARRGIGRRAEARRRPARCRPGTASGCRVRPAISTRRPTTW